MSKNIIVTWDVSETSGTESLSFEDLNIGSEEEWNNLPESKKESLLQDYLDNLPERVSIVVSKFKLK